MTPKKKFVISLAIVFAAVILSFLFVVSKPEKDTKSIFLYTVQPNDTCGKIAVVLSVSAKSIIETNNLQKDCSDIYAGQVLSVPYPTPTPHQTPGPTHLEVTIDCERETYLVRDGDTLTSIAEKYNTSEDVISFFNGLTNDKIYPGMELAIPICYITPTPSSIQ